MQDISISDFFGKLETSTVTLDGFIPDVNLFS